MNSVHKKKLHKLLIYSMILYRYRTQRLKRLRTEDDGGDSIKICLNFPKSKGSFEEMLYIQYSLTSGSIFSAS